MNDNIKKIKWSWAWHIRGILRNQKHSLQVASGSSCTAVTNMTGKCESTLKNDSEFVPVCH